MLGSIFHKRKKAQDLRTPSLQDIKRFRDTYARNVEKRSVEPPACIERSVYKAISSQKDLHTVDFRQEDITDPQLIALAETLAEIPIMSSLDLRDNRITDDGAKSLLEVLRLQIIAAKTPVPCDPKSKRPLYPQVPEFTKYITSVNLRGNEVSAEVQQELLQYTSILRREDKRLEIRAALAQMDRDTSGTLDEDEFRGVLKLLTGTEPSKKELRGMIQEYTHVSDSAQGALSLENMLLARCSSPTSNKAASPPWEALVQVRHADLGTNCQSTVSRPERAKSASAVSKPISPPKGSPDVRSARSASSAYSDSSAPPSPSQIRVPSPVPSIRSADRFEKAALSYAGSEASAQSPRDLSVSGKFEEAPSTSTSPAPSPYPTPTATPNAKPSTGSLLTSPPLIPPLVFPPSSPDMLRGSSNSARSTSAVHDDEKMTTPSKGSLTKQLSGSQSRGFGGLALNSSSGYSPRISELLDSPRSVTSSTSSKRVTPGENHNTAQPSPNKQGMLPQDSPRFDDDDLSLALGSTHEDNKFGNYSSTDDLLHSAMDQSSTSEKDDLTQGAGEVPPSNPGSEIDFSSHYLDDRRNLSDTGSAFNFCESNESQQERSQPIRYSCDLRANQSKTSNSEWVESKSENENIATRDADIEIGPEILDKKNADSDDDEEIIDIVEADVTKDSKPWVTMKVVHWELRKGLKLTELPNEPPFRNLIALVLSKNKLRDLSLLEECRFPCTLVLDLSQNRLTKIPDKTLAIFPKLQVLDIAHNELKAISGVLESFKLRALNVSHNSIRSVTNVEHLLQLEVLSLSHNCISAVQSLRLLSLNKMLKRIDLDGNPIVEADERQRRKNITYILNLVPSLTSLGCIKIASLQSKEKKKKGPECASIHGPSIFDEQYFPTLHEAWVKLACDWIEQFQDVVLESRSEGDCDEYDQQDNDNGGDPTNCTKKPLNRSQQRQKDELRSRAVAYRSRQKAPPSPPKQKASIYSFGPPLPPPSPKKKKAIQSDPAAVRRQMRRSSELSAPKHPPVDTNLLKQETKRKSRGAFDLNMSVAEKLQLAKEQAERRSSVATSKRSASQVKKAVKIDPDTSNQETKPESPRNFSPTKEVVAFRIEPLSSVRRQEVLEFLVEPPRAGVTAEYPRKISDYQERQPSPSPKRPSATPKGDPFLRSLAVGDFLNHASEELSTALTALNVLLSMSEKGTSEPSKLNDYRASLEALDILNEEESHELYEKTRAFENHDQESECAQAFERLQLVKRCMRQLLEKLHDHAPGSAVIRAFCRSMRSTELRSVLSEYTECSPDTTVRQQPSMQPTTISSEHLGESSDNLGFSTENQSPSPSSVTARLFSSSANIARTEEDALGSLDSTISKETTAAVQLGFEKKDNATADGVNDFGPGTTEGFEGDDDLDFLDHNDSVFDIDDSSKHNGYSQESQIPLGDEDGLDASDSVANAASIFEAALLESSELDGAPGNELDGDPYVNPSDNSIAAITTYSEAEIDKASETADEIEAMINASDPFMDHESSLANDSNDDWLGEKVSSDLEAVEASLQVEGSSVNWDTGKSTLEQNSGTEFGDSIDTTATCVQAEDLSEAIAESHDDFDSLLEGTTAIGVFDAEIETPGEVYAEPTDAHSYEEPVQTEFCEEHQAPEEQSIAFEDPSDIQAHEETVEAQEEFQEYEVEQGEAQLDEFQEDETAYEQAGVDSIDLATLASDELASGEDADDEEAEVFGDWEKGFDPNTNHYFWFNHSTGESSWEPPEGWPFEVDEPFEAEDEHSAEDESAAFETTEEEPAENTYETETGDGEVANEEVATESHETAESGDDLVTRASEFEPSRASEFEFDDSDLPSF